jgi:type IV secretory pathway VirB10-like protein
MKRIKTILSLLVVLVGSFSKSPILQAEMGWDGPTNKNETKARYFMHTGFTFDAVLYTAIFSLNLQTPVIVETESNILFRGRTMLPKGTKIIGTSNITKSADRVNVTFTTIVFPDGQEMNFNGLALAPDGSAGVPGIVKDLKKSVMPVKVIVKTAGAAAAATTNQPVAGEMIGSIADEMHDDLAEKQTYSITVKKGAAILVYVQSRLEY